MATTIGLGGDELRSRNFDLACDLEHDGFQRHELAIRQIARAALAAGVSPVLAGILTDPSEPEVARLRAFGRVAAALAAPAATDHHIHAAA
jgi:hypothetical protein